MKSSTIARFVAPVVILALPILQAACSQQDSRHDFAKSINQHAVWEPSSFVADKLRNNRIVMVADNGHGVSLYYSIIISTLNSWISEFEHPSSPNSIPSLPRKVFLVLEMDSVMVRSLKRYFETSNTLDIIKPEHFVGYQFTTSTLEFYDDLRHFKNRVDSLNSSKQSQDRVGFDVFGPEKVIDLTAWTQEWSQRFFVDERDEFLSAQIQRLLDSIPNAKALVYYGASHLERRRVAKLDKNKGWGYFMAHYLSESFSDRGGAYTCAQVPVRSNAAIDPVVKEMGKTFAIDNSFLKGMAIESGSSSIPTDGTVFLDDVPRTPCHISNVISENLVDLVLNNLATYSDTTKPYYRAILLSNLSYLERAAQQTPIPTELNSVKSIDDEIAAWKRWRKSSRLDFVRNMSTNKNKEIVVENLIQLLWVGSNSEIRKAITVLKRDTGYNFRTAKDWTSWWQEQQVHK